jgi:hypothetical protein
MTDQVLGVDENVSDSMDSSSVDLHQIGISYERDQVVPAAATALYVVVFSFSDVAQNSKGRNDVLILAGV